MNTPDVHPDMELLDRLRAGLLDDDPRRRELETHLSACEYCRQRSDWRTVMNTVELATPAIEQRLNNARKQALHAPQRSLAPRRLVPLAAAASIALLAVVLVNPWQQTDNTDSQLAASSTDAPEFYEELDFYLWLADHKRVDEDSAT